MLPFKLLGRFLLRLVLIYALLAAAWLVVGDAYQAVFRAAGERVFEALTADTRVSFQPFEPSDQANKDTVIKLRSAVGRQRVRCSSHILGYDPTVVLFALVLATPGSGRRRLWSLMLGAFLVCGFVELRVGLLILDALSDAKAGMVTLSPFLKWLVGGAAKLAARIPSSYVVPVFIWIIVAFRAKDWVRIAGPTNCDS